MPLLKIVTNQRAPEAQALTAALSREVAEMLGKEEEWVMVLLEEGREMRFAGSDAPTAYVELKSIGLPKGQVGEFSARLCRVVGGALGIVPGRVYIEFTDVVGALWGWDGGTF